MLPIFLMYHFRIAVTASCFRTRILASSWESLSCLTAINSRKGDTWLIVVSIRVQELGQGMILAVYQLNLLSCTASGPRDCRQTAQKFSTCLRSSLRVGSVSRLWLGNQTMTIGRAPKSQKTRRGVHEEVSRMHDVVKHYK